MAAVLLVGSLTSNAEAVEFEAVDRLLSVIRDEAARLAVADEPECPALAIPGPDDREALSPKRAALRSLQGSWAATEGALFQGDAPEELAAIESAFGLYELWSADQHAALPGWHGGMVPGDGSCTLDIAGSRVGIISVNSALRMLSSPASPDIATCGPAQVADAVGTDDIGTWARDRDAVVLVAASRGAGESGTVPIGDHVGLFADDGAVPAQDPFTWRATVGSSVVCLVDVARAVTARGTSEEQRSSRGFEREPRADGAADNPNEAPGERGLSRDDATRSFTRDIATGRAALLVFDGLAQLCKPSGAAMSDRAELRGRLLRLLGVGDDDRRAGLGDLLRFSCQRDPQGARAAVREVSDIEESSPLVRRLVSAPWTRVYDTTGSSAYRRVLDEDSALAKSVTVTDAHVESTSARPGVRQVIALNGEGQCAPEAVTFSMSAGHGKTPRDTWHRRLSADFVTRPVVVLAATTDDPDLWAYLDLRGDAGADASRPAPATYLVCPQVGAEARWRLDVMGVSLIEETSETFVAVRLAPNRQEIAIGGVALARAGTRGERAKGMRLLTALLGEVAAGTDRTVASGDFLRGHDPSWQDIATERPPRLSRLAQLAARASVEPGQRQVVLLLGRSGSGKTTTLMQFGADLVRSGLTVGWVDRSFGEGRKMLVEEAIDLSVDAVLLDDVDMFGSESLETMRLLNRNGKVLVVGSARRTALYALEGVRSFTTVDQDEPLTDDDIRKVIAALTRYSLLNSLRGVRPAAARVQRFHELSRRDLMAGLIQVVEGQPFDERVASEYQQLQGLERDAYGIVSVVSHVNKAPTIPGEHLVQMLASAPPYREAQTAIDALIDQRLIDEDVAGAVKCRHRAIADRVVETMGRGGDGLVSAMGALLFFYAEQAHEIRDPGEPDRRQMIALLNHNLMRKLGLPAADVRNLYDSVREWLEEDLHYWLQRGSYEVEIGDFQRAAGYLSQARGCVGGDDDYKVLTEWGSLQLQLAAAQSMNARLHEAAVLGLATLEQVAKRHGKNSPHTFAIVARDGTHWVTTSRVMDDGERLDRVVQIQSLLDLGTRVSHNAVFLEEAAKARPVLSKLMERPDPGVPII
ncbi:P-loop NTPase [Modestobacter sp. VKM Ac-2985]|uniref:P-loop NTPase n=1 Tax=Modestobacter sp. VKM Ac-2985 TaxID=3004139 RepID=UPI0022AB9BD8|nr:hypothetical protein [Modestobacter sp. VKM Ac-2985]MCZ2838887.1 hypothetical protein [Modestobacter sp. VKM Ac-2985]